MTCGSRNPFLTAGAPAAPVQPLASNASAPGNGSAGSVGIWPELLSLFSREVLEKLQAAWDYGRSHQLAVVCTGLLACIMAVFMAGRIRLRRIDAVASVLWLLVMGVHMLEHYLETGAPRWLDTVKLGTTSLCCLVGFAAAVATRKSSGQRRSRARRYLSGGSVHPLCGADASLLSPALSGSLAFVPTPPPNLSRLISHQLAHRARRPSPSSLPGRLNRALSLGTIPSLTRTDSGYLFSGSRPSSQCKDSSPSDYSSLKPGSRPASPGPSPTPSVAGSVTSSSGSARQRRPLISPARLQLGGRRLQLFSSPAAAPCAAFAPEVPAFPPHQQDSGYLFSGSRPSSQCKDSSPSDYSSLKPGSRPASPGPSPTPSVAGSVTSSSGSARQRRPLISPARLQLGGRRLQLFSSPAAAPCAAFAPEVPAFPPHQQDSGYLFSGSRPSSQCKDSSPSDYSSLKPGSRPASPGPSPTPSVAGSVTSSSGSARQRRPLISPARLQLGGRRLQLFSSPAAAPCAAFAPEVPAFPPHQQESLNCSVCPDWQRCPFTVLADARSVLEGGSVFGDAEQGKKDSSSGSSTCMVDTTTGGGADSGAGWKGLLGRSLWQGMLGVSLTLNIVLTGAYVYHSWR
ncbi:TM201 protein, partial [Atractosteus spatula]|nr:TM201 protein [Atractosteus spatula]